MTWPTQALAGTCTDFIHSKTKHVCAAMAIPRVAWFSAWHRHGAKTVPSKFSLFCTLHRLLRPNLNIKKMIPLCSSERCRDGDEEECICPVASFGSCQDAMWPLLLNAWMWCGAILIHPSKEYWRLEVTRHTPIVQVDESPTPQVSQSRWQVRLFVGLTWVQERRKHN